MKYGLLMHKPTTNWGDDIQSYAIRQFLPHVDYIINREEINSFESDDKEPVAIVMAAWWMWYKWNWPPSKYVLPYFTGFHYSDNKAAKQAGCPANFLFLSGLGGKYMNAYGPVGCRDYFTRENLKFQKVNAEFSGCITLTLPEQKKVKPEKEYICIVDVAASVEKKIREQLEGTDIEIKKITHDLPKEHKSLSWEERMDKVEELLTIYQNAKCVVTRRLHCALPCLAMGVPTLLAIHTLESIRFIPYYDWLHCCLPKQFASGEYEYDVTNPPANPTLHMETREKLIAGVKGFVADAEKNTLTADELKRKHFRCKEKKIEKWRNKNMKITAQMWEEEMAPDWNEKEKKTNAEIYKRINEIKKTRKLENLQKQNKIYGELMVAYLKQARRIFAAKKKAEAEAKKKKAK